jgi:hypothetical protein
LCCGGVLLLLLLQQWLVAAAADGTLLVGEDALINTEVTIQLAASAR